MNYSLIEDAWKNSDYITEQFKLYDNPYEKNIKALEAFDSLDIDYNFQQPNINQEQVPLNVQVPEQNKSNCNCTFNCDDFWDHLQTCKECRIKIRKIFSSKIIENLQNVILDNKETILLILICFFILIFFNLLLKIFKN